jgi:hypothetical protein
MTTHFFGKTFVYGGTCLILFLFMGTFLTGCVSPRLLTENHLPVLPVECKKVMDFYVEPLPNEGQSNSAGLAVDMAKEGTIRQKEHETSKVCASYAINVDKQLREGPIWAWLPSSYNLIR